MAPQGVGHRHPTIRHRNFTSPSNSPPLRNTRSVIASAPVIPETACGYPGSQQRLALVTIPDNACSISGMTVSELVNRIWCKSVCCPAPAPHVEDLAGAQSGLAKGRDPRNLSRMPELPEVEIVRRGLAPAMEGASFAAVTLNRADLRFPFEPGFARRLKGQRVERLTRRAKYIIAETGSGLALAMHLGMTGRFTILAWRPGRRRNAGRVLLQRRCRSAPRPRNFRHERRRHDPLQRCAPLRLHDAVRDGCDGRAPAFQETSARSHWPVPSTPPISWSARKASRRRSKAFCSISA